MRSSRKSLILAFSSVEPEVFFLGISFHERTNVVSTSINVLAEWWKFDKSISEFIGYFKITFSITKWTSRFDAFNKIFLFWEAVYGKEFRADAVKQFYVSCTLSTNHIRTSQWCHNLFRVCVVLLVRLALSFYCLAELLPQWGNDESLDMGGNDSSIP